MSTQRCPVRWFIVVVTVAALIVVSACSDGTSPDAPRANQGSQPNADTSAGAPAPTAADRTTATPSTATPSTATPGTAAPPTATPSAASPTTATPRPPKRTPDPAPLLAAGAKGEQVRELQHRLRQLGWFSGAITGSYTRRTVEAVGDFQQKRQLTRSGTVDRSTWSQLLSATRKPTADQLHNVLRPGRAILKRGVKGDRVRALQARLRQIGWYAGRITPRYGSATVASVRGFQRKRKIPVTGEVDARTYHRLTAMTRKPSYNEKHNVVPKRPVARLDSRCRTGRALCVSKRSDFLVWVIDGKPQLRVDVRFGSAELPTRNGAFRVRWKSRNHVSSIYRTSMPYAMFFSGGQAVHYSPDFAARGYRGASHGCVNVRDRRVMRRLFNTVRVGDKVIVYS